MGKIEKVGNLESQNLSIEKHLKIPILRNIISVLIKISPFRMKKFEINEMIQYETFFQ
jgi:hypothetical protein